MKELIIFFIIFLLIFAFNLFIFNGRFIYAQIKYDVLGPSPVGQDTNKKEKEWGVFNGLPNSSDMDFLPILTIPKIGIEAPIMLTQSNNESIIQKDLEKGLVRYPNSNIILGHSSAYPWYKGNYGSVFSLLNKLERGDEFFIYSGDTKYNYQVLEKEIKLPKDLSFENSDDNSVIYLVSCWPINTSWKRIVIKAGEVDPAPLVKGAMVDK